MQLILLGPPGSGKGTQAVRIAENLGVPAISTGDIFRTELKNNTPLGTEAKSYMEKGELVPDEVVIGMVKSRISQEDCADGFILDGFPRTIPQAEGLDTILKEMNISLDRVIDIKVGDELIVKRLTGRMACEDCKKDFNKFFSPPKEEGLCDACGGKLISRADDNEETIKNRLEVYHSETAPLIEYYADSILSVEGEKAPDDVFADILSNLKG